VYALKGGKGVLKGGKGVLKGRNYLVCSWVEGFRKMLH